MQTHVAVHYKAQLRFLADYPVTLQTLHLHVLNPQLS